MATRRHTMTVACIDNLLFGVAECCSGWERTLTKAPPPRAIWERGQGSWKGRVKDGEQKG